MKTPLLRSPIHKFQYCLTSVEAHINVVLPTLATRTDLLTLDHKFSDNLNALDRKLSDNLTGLDGKFMSALAAFETRMLKWFITMGISFAALWMSSLGIVFALVEARVVAVPVVQTADSLKSHTEGIRQANRLDQSQRQAQPVIDERSKQIGQ